jgi:hypothetical protein
MPCVEKQKKKEEHPRENSRLKVKSLWRPVEMHPGNKGERN